MWTTSKRGLSALGANRNIVLVDGTDEEMARMVTTFPKDMERTDKQGRTWNAFFTAFSAMQHGFHMMHWLDSVPVTVIVSEPRRS